MYGLPNSYDEWKTACCGQYPNCGNCPMDRDDDEEQEEEEEEWD